MMSPMVRGWALVNERGELADYAGLRVWQTEHMAVNEAVDERVAQVVVTVIGQPMTREQVKQSTSDERHRAWERVRALRVRMADPNTPESEHDALAAEWFAVSRLYDLPPTEEGDLDETLESAMARDEAWWEEWRERQWDREREDADRKRAARHAQIVDEIRGAAPTSEDYVMVRRCPDDSRESMLRCLSQPSDSPNAPTEPGRDQTNASDHVSAGTGGGEPQDGPVTGQHGAVSECAATEDCHGRLPNGHAPWCWCQGCKSGLNRGCELVLRSELKVLSEMLATVEGNADGDGTIERASLIARTHRVEEQIEGLKHG